ncbi:MAG TPA: NADPH:quinone oxidoreductase family protein [Xanthomonadaceae bacterium]|nr:NADPH:quinone oxidoreductase family protein [Xanthomonadaceae bacterium]
MNSMRAILCETLGPPSALKLAELPLPVPGPKQLRVRVHAAGVNFPDALIVQGLYQMRPPLPFVPGAELAGEVIEVGDAVRGFAVGDRVAAVPLLGAFAEQALVDAAQAIPLPRDIDETLLQAAAAVALAHGTSLHALEERGKAQPGETLLVLGAAGGVGLAAVELGKRLGLTVIAAASSADKLAAAQAAGADHGIDYSHEDLRERVKALTDGRGVDLVYDPVGGELAESALRCLGWRGRYLVVGFAGGGIPKFAANLLLLKEASLLGVFWGEAARRDPAAHAGRMQRLFGWLAEGSLSPRIHARLPLAETGKALDMLLARAAVGKLLILPHAQG